MATDAGFATFVTEQASDAGDVRVRRMFGEYALYLGHKAKKPKRARATKARP